jgi:hypothetical protein
MISGYLVYCVAGTLELMIGKKATKASTVVAMLLTLPLISAGGWKYMAILTKARV